MSWISCVFLNSRQHAKSRIDIIERLLDDIELPKDGKALELGCGAGFASAHIAGKYGMDVVGTDADPGRIQTAVRKNGNANGLSFMTADATRLPFKEYDFDLVLSQNVFHHIADWRSAAGEVARVTRPGGLFVFSEIRGAGLAMRIFSRLHKDHGFHEEEGLTSLLDELGFRVAKRLEPGGQAGKKYAILFERKAASGVLP